MAKSVETKGAPKESLMSGAIAGLASVLALQPLDVLKTRLQEPSPLSTKIRIMNVYRTDGLVGYWRGTLPTLIRNVPGVALYFVTLNQLRYLVFLGHHRQIPFLDSLYDKSQNRVNGMGNLLIGATARTIAGTILMPATLLKVRFESSHYKHYHGLWSATQSIFRQEGLRGFFRGTVMTALRDAPHAGLYLFFYELLKSTVLDQGPSHRLMAGMMAGGLATCCTQPFDLLKTRIQLAPINSGRGIYHIFFETIQGDGIRGLFKGVGPRMLRKGLSSAITWTIFEELMLKLFKK